MKSSYFRWPFGVFLLPLAFMFAAKPVFAQQPAAFEAENLKARIDAAARALGDNPRFKGLSAKDRQGLVEFVAGNMLFVLLHEMAHVVHHCEWDCRCWAGWRTRPIVSRRCG